MIKNGILNVFERNHAVEGNGSVTSTILGRWVVDDIGGITLSESAMWGKEMCFIKGMSSGPGAWLTIASNTSALEMPPSNVGADIVVGSALSAVTNEHTEANNFFLNYSLCASNTK